MWSQDGRSLRAILYVSFSLLRDFLQSSEGILFENTHKMSLQKTEMNLRRSNIFQQNETEWQVIFFTKMYYLANEKPDNIVPINYFRKLSSVNGE